MSKRCQTAFLIRPLQPELTTAGYSKPYLEGQIIDRDVRVSENVVVAMP